MNFEEQNTAADEQDQSHRSVELEMDVTMNIDEQKIASLLCCGFEGGVGYWCRIVGYKEPAKKRGIIFEDEVFPHIDYPLTGGAVVCRTTDESEPNDLVLDREAIDKGLELMASEQPHHFANFVSDKCLYDAETGDVFIQLCLLGKVVYG